MSQCSRILAVLSDGQPHAMTAIHREVGFCRLNSRVSELRSRGHKIECWRDGDDYVYRLLVSEASSNPARALVTTTDQMAVRDGDASQASLFQIPATVRGAYDEEAA